MQKIIERIDGWQRHHRLPGFIYAVLKKYGDDETGYQAALLTYYAFLALFPLLLILTTLTVYIPASHAELQSTIVKGTTNYFPVLGSQLSDNVSTLHKSGLALLIGILFTLYGARGVADAFRNGIQNLWKIPAKEREGFPKSTLKSLSIIIIAGAGFVVASISIGLANSAGQGWLYHLLPPLINFVIWFWLFSLLINLSLPRHISLKETRVASIIAAVGLVVLQVLGSLVLKRELQRLDALYSYFALALGLLFWIYLQAQVIFYALQVASVRSQKLWPRSLTGQPTPADTQIAKGASD